MVVQRVRKVKVGVLRKIQSPWHARKLVSGRALQRQGVKPALVQPTG
jgi:hypothetical protein